MLEEEMIHENNYWEGIRNQDYEVHEHHFIFPDVALSNVCCYTRELGLNVFS